MASKKIFLTDDQLLQILENDDWSDIEVLSDDDDGWEPENAYEKPADSEGMIFFTYYIRKKHIFVIFRSGI